MEATGQSHSSLMKVPVRPILLASINVGHFKANEQPNILWIFSEDNACRWPGSYGNSKARALRLYALASGGLLFSHA